MPFPIIGWIILGFITGAAVSHFWKEIQQWATLTLSRLLDGLNKAIEVTSKAVVYLIKQGAYIYKMVQVHSQNIQNNQITKYQPMEVVPPQEVPDDIMKELNQKTQLRVMEQAT